MENVRCNLCGADDTALWGTKNGIDIVQCKHCGLIYCNPRPSNEELQKFYCQDYFKEGHYEEDVLRQKMYRIEIEEISRNLGHEGRFLDVGCAVGKFLATLPPTFEKWGTEFSEDAANMGRKKFGLNIKTGQIRHIDLPEKYFDIVQMRGVLEHSQDPMEDLTKIRKVLKDNGTLRISQLPNIDSLCAKIFRTSFNQVKPGEHLYYFSPKTIDDILARTGFKTVKRLYPYMGTPYESLAKDLLRLLTYRLQRKDSPPFFGNMMIVYAKKVS
ncbi:MAG: class I SAM-dependent methyltransferase [Candidatus Omnitrophota bacterium]|jgi:ubiquinone/menaquinone biosynthesis C-methylase UbiE